MANVHCQSCGRTYDYDKYGCCPNCGAYKGRQVIAKTEAE